MLVKQEQLNPCEVELQVEVEAEKVASAIDSTYKDIAKDTTVPGFRKGKAPRVVLENFLDAEAVKERAANRLLRSAYSEALDESKLEPYAPADVELVKFEVGEPMVFKAKVPLAPKIELGEYVGLEIERDLHSVTDEEVEEQINSIRERAAVLTAVTDRPVQQGDVVGVKLGGENAQEEQPPIKITIGENLPEFDEGLVGMSIGDEKGIDVKYPEDYAAEDLRGQERHWDVSIISIENKSLPELTDDWVKETFGSEEETEGEAEAEGAEAKPERIDTVQKLRDRIKSNMERSAVEQADQSVRDQVVKKAIENANICYPEVMVSEAVDHRVEELAERLKQRKLNLDDYLKHTKQSIEDLRKGYEEDVKEYLDLLLVMREIVEKEKIEVKDEDLDEEISATAAQRGTTPEAVRAYMEKAGNESEIRNQLLRKKVVDFLVHASNIKSVGS